MRLMIPVRVPRNVCVPTELLAELIGPEKVVQLLRSGLIEKGQKDYHRHGRRGRAPSAEEVRAAADEVQRQTALLEKEMRDATHD